MWEAYVDWVLTICCVLCYVVGEGSRAESLPLSCCPTWTSGLWDFLTAHLHPGWLHWPGCPTGCGALLNNPAFWAEKNLFSSLDDSIFNILRCGCICLFPPCWLLFLQETEPQTLKILTLKNLHVDVFFRNFGLFPPSCISVLMLMLQHNLFITD